jgi:uncharacterized protein
MGSVLVSVLVAASVVLVAACASEEPAVTVVGSGASMGKPGAGADPSSQELAPSATPSAVVSDPSGVTFAPGAGPSAVVPTTALPGPFRTITVHLTRPDGSSFDWCLLLADTEDLRARGLMGVTDLAGYDGMLFRFGTDQSVSFWMRDTVIPLSIAFFRADTAFVSTNDMVPCPPDASAVCPQHSAAAPYADAIETMRGVLAAAGVVAGSTLRVGELGCAVR